MQGSSDVSQIQAYGSHPSLDKKSESSVLIRDVSSNVSSTYFPPGSFSSVAVHAANSLNSSIQVPQLASEANPALTTANASMAVMHPPCSSSTVASPQKYEKTTPQGMVYQREYYVYSDEHVGELKYLKQRVESADVEFSRFREKIGQLEYENERLRVEKDGLIQQLRFYEREGVDYRRMRADMSTLLREREDVLSQVAKLEDQWAVEVQRIRQENQELKRELNVLQYRTVREGDARGKILRAEEEMKLLDKENLRLTTLLKEKDEEIQKLKQQAETKSSPTALTKAEVERSRFEELLSIERTERLHSEEIISALREEVAALHQELSRVNPEHPKVARAPSSPVVAMTPPPPPPAPVAVRPMLGVDIKTLDDGIGGKDNVVVVHGVLPGGPAEQAGIRAEDILQLYNGRHLDSKAAFQQQLESSEVGSQVMLGVWRQGKSFSFPVTVGATTAAAATKARPKKVKPKAPSY